MQTSANQETVQDGNNAPALYLEGPLFEDGKTTNVVQEIADQQDLQNFLQERNFSEAMAEEIMTGASEAGVKFPLRINVTVAYEEGKTRLTRCVLAFPPVRSSVSFDYIPDPDQIVLPDFPFIKGDGSSYINVFNFTSKEDCLTQLKDLTFTEEVLAKLSKKIDTEDVHFPANILLMISPAKVLVGLEVMEMDVMAENKDLLKDL